MMIDWGQVLVNFAAMLTAITVVGVFFRKSIRAISTLAQNWGEIAKLLPELPDMLTLLKELDRRSLLDYADKQEQKKYNKAIARGLMRALRHLAEGNHTGEMSKAADRLNDFFIDGEE